MHEKHLHESEMQEEYLDLLIRSAFAWKDLKEKQAIFEESRQEISAEELARRDRILAQLRTRKIREERRKTVWTLQKAALIAAALLLVIVIGAPLAIAHVGPIRTRVIKMLVEINDRYAAVSMQDVSAPVPPEEWMGEYYPQYMPGGFTISEGEEFYSYVEYRDELGRKIKFAESKDVATLNFDSEETVISTTLANGQEAILIEKDEKTRLIWSNDERFFMIVSDISSDEIIRIADSVKKINLE